MVNAILDIVSGLAKSIGGYFGYRAASNSQRRDAEKDVAAREAEIKTATESIKEAVYSADDKRLNEIVIGLMRPVFALAALGVIALGGCSTKESPTKVIYIPTDRNIETVTNSIGIECKAVPDALMVEMLAEINALRELQREAKVDRRVGK